MLEERRVRELLDHPLSHHHLLQLQQLQQQAQQQHQSHHHRGGDRDRGDRDHHHHHRERDRERERERQYHHHVQQQHHRERERAERGGGERDRDHHRGERDRELRERDRERSERHQEQYLHHRHSQSHQQQQEQQHQNSISRQEQQLQREREQLLASHGLEERKQFDCGGSALPKGWVREEIIRKTGLSAGKIDVCYHSPNGKKFWSKPQLSRFLGDTVDLSTFDFRTGKVNNLLLRKNKKHRPHTDYSRGIRSDTTLLPPIRQTASIFKQPVTVHKTQKLSTVKVDFKHGHQEKPKQLFWEKRLEGLRSCDRAGLPLDNLDLPRGVEPVGPNIHPETVLQSVATALHVNGQPITGQTMPRTNLENNPGVYINPDQPLIQAVNIREDEINRQEEKVLAARKKLEDALKAYDLS